MLPGGSREASARLAGGSREAPGRLPGGSGEPLRATPTLQRSPRGALGPPRTRQDPPRTPQEPPKNPLKTLFGDPCPRRFGAIAHQESVSSRSGVLKGVFQKSARRLDGKHILEDFVLLHRPEKCLSQPSASTDWCKMSFSRQGSWHTSRNLANRKNGTPPPPLTVAPSVRPSVPQRGGGRGGYLSGETFKNSEIQKFRQKFKNSSHQN